MRQIRIEKITLNIGAGKDQQRLDKSLKLMQNITGTPAVKTFTNKRIPTWGIRPGLPIGCKITLRKQRAKDIISRLLKAVDNKLLDTQFDEQGNVAFGIPEYIDIPGVRYDPEIGIMGLQVCITLERPGFRVKRRKCKKKKIHQHKISKQEAISFLQKEFEVHVENQK